MARREREDFGAPLGVPQRPLEQITWSSREATRSGPVDAMARALGARVGPLPMVVVPGRQVERIPID
jgi:hypothetical protein